MFKQSRFSVKAREYVLETLLQRQCPIKIFRGRSPRQFLMGTTANSVQRSIDDGVSSQLIIPVQDQGADDAQSDEARSQGIHLARQERWGDVISAIGTADRTLAATCGGLPVADLIAYGARADIINGVEHAIFESGSPDEPALLSGIMALEEARAPHRDDPLMAALVSQAHLDVGWAWRSEAGAKLASNCHEARAQAHFDRAWGLIEPFVDYSKDSPFVASAYCAALATQKVTALQVADAFGALIQLDPLNYRNMRALGHAMLPDRFGAGAGDTLELEARRTAARCEHIWGAGGYSWTYFDALLTDNTACLHVDTDFFVDGLRDIVHNRPCQEVINLLIAFCAIGIQKNRGHCTQADAVRTTIAEAADWLVRFHLQEIHPAHWAHASDGFASNTHIASPRRFIARGRADAQRFLQDCFRHELASGQQVRFTEAGLELTTG